MERHLKCAVSVDRPLSSVRPCGREFKKTRLYIFRRRIPIHLNFIALTFFFKKGATFKLKSNERTACVFIWLANWTIFPTGNPRFNLTQCPIRSAHSLQTSARSSVSPFCFCYLLSAVLIGKGNTAGGEEMDRVTRTAFDSQRNMKSEKTTQPPTCPFCPDFLVELVCLLLSNAWKHIRPSPRMRELCTFVSWKPFPPFQEDSVRLVLSSFVASCHLLRPRLFFLFF